MLHGLWKPGMGLVLWHDTPQDAAPGPVPQPVAELLPGVRFRHRTEVPAPDSNGARQVSVSAHTLGPDRAAEFLAQPLPDDAIAGDLRFLNHVARGVRRWAQAGRVVPQLVRDDGTWWTRWRLVGGERQRAWQAELLAAMPAVQRAQGQASALLADFVTELTDPITRLDIAPSTSSHPLLTSLLKAEPLDEGFHRVGELLEQWRASYIADEPSLLLRLLEPDDDEEPTARQGLWRLEVCLRPDGEAPRPILLKAISADQLRTATIKLGDALKAYPRLRDVPKDPLTLDLLLPPEVVIDLVAHGAAALTRAGIALLLPRAWKVAEPSMRLKVAGAKGTSAVPATESTVAMSELVSYRWELVLGDTVLTPGELDQLMATNSDLVRLRDGWVQVDRRTIAAAAKYITGHNHDRDTSMADLFSELATGHFPDVPVTDVEATGWTAALLNPEAQPIPVEPPAGLTATLRPYQQRGLSWLALMSRLGLGAVLADDMGLGKTVQVLALLTHERDAATESLGATLLVCPMSLVGNWQREAAQFAPGLRVMVHHGATRTSGDELRDAIGEADLVITTYAVVARDHADLREIAWERVVLDEAQHIKNASTAQSRACRTIPARHRVALTGTPVENRLEELRSILDFTNPKLLGSAQTFRARFAVPIERDRNHATAARLRTLTAPFVLRRVKTDPTVISDLPEKLEMTVRANLTAEQASLYQAVVDDMLRKIAESEGMARKGAVLSAITRLKQVCNHPTHFLSDGSSLLRRGRHRSGKLLLVEDILDSVLADGEKALLFTQFREFGELIAPYFEERFGTPIPFLHGGVAKKGRDRMVEKFQSDDGPPIMLLSLKAGGTGLTLTAANHVVHLDRWWNPAVENQATDRAFRIGQTRNVQVRKLVCVGTVEERIDDMLTSKAEIADLAIGTGENWITEMSGDQLRDLFTLGQEAVGE